MRINKISGLTKKSKKELNQKWVAEPEIDVTNAVIAVNSNENVHRVWKSQSNWVNYWKVIVKYSNRWSKVNWSIRVENEWGFVAIIWKWVVAKLYLIF